MKHPINYRNTPEVTAEYPWVQARWDEFYDANMNMIVCKPWAVAEQIIARVHLHTYRTAHWSQTRMLRRMFA